MEDYTNLTAVLIWIVGGGSLYAVNWLIATFLEKVPWWDGLAKPIKILVPLLVAILLSVGAYYALFYKEVIAGIQPLFKVIVAIIFAYFGSQTGYMATKNVKAQENQVVAQLKSTLVQKAQLVEDVKQRVSEDPG